MFELHYSVDLNKLNDDDDDILGVPMNKLGNRLIDHLALMYQTKYQTRGVHVVPARYRKGPLSQRSRVRVRVG